MFRRLPKSLCIPIAVLLLSFLAGGVSAQNRGTFVGAVNYPAGAPTVPSNTGFLGGGVLPLEAKLGDVNGDGKPDVIVAAACSSPALGLGIPGCPSSGYAVVVYLANGDGTFQAPLISSVTSLNIRSIAVGDFNNDGKLDVAVVSDCDPADCTQGTVSILLGAGDGTFTQAAQYTFDGAVLQAGTAAVGDFNNDGKLDLAVGIGCFNLSVTGCATGAVSVYWGNGDGTLSAPTNYPAPGNTAASLVVGDFNGDGKLDIIAGSGVSNFSSLTILLGSGSGAFAESSVSFSFGLSSLATADFNSDRKLDLAIMSYAGSLTILTGNGDGTFQVAETVPTGLGNAVTNGSSIAIADLNGDGKPDLTVSGTFGPSSVNGVQVFLNDGSGNFTTGASYPLAGWEYASIVAADFNSDGKIDVVMASECSESPTPGNHCPDGSIDVLLGNGDGTFQGPTLLSNSVNGGPGAYSNGSADFNGDGIPDLFSTSVCSSSTTCGAGILLSKPDGTYQPQTIVLSGAQEPLYSIAGDFNKDGKQDLAILNACDSFSTCVSPSVTVLLGNGDGTFQPPVTYPLGGNISVTGIVIGDFNGDGKLDIATGSQCSDANCTQGLVNVLLGNGDGTFQPVISTPVGSYPIGRLAAGDFANNGRTDLAVGSFNPTTASGVVAILMSNGDGTFTNTVTYNSGGTGSLGGIAVGSLRLNNVLDIVVGSECEPITADTNCSNGIISVLLGNGDGTFTQGQILTVTDGNLVSAALADTNGDNLPDFVGVTTAGIVVAPGKGMGLFCHRSATPASEKLKAWHQSLLH